MTAPTRRRPPTGSRRLPPSNSRQQQRERLRRRIRTASVGCLAMVPVCLLFWVLLASPLLAVSRVEVTGTSRLSVQEVLQAADLRPGTPLARVDSPALRARVAALAPVARVRVVRAWPHTLRLQVTERVPLAATRAADGTWALVDVAGVRFAAAAENPPGLPELQAGPEQEADAVRVVAELPSALRDRVVAVQVPTPSSVVLRLREGRSVVWGPPGDAARKAAVVMALLPRPGTTIDVTSPDVAVVR